MKKYIIMVIMICFFAVPFTAFAEENNNNIQKKTLQQQVEQQYIEPEDYIPVLMYHHFKTEEVEPGNGANMHIDEFEEHMKTLQQAGYTPIFLSELYDIMKQAQIEKETGVVVPELQLDKKYVVITIDDGYRSNYELAYPLLQKYNMKACISVITSRIHTGYVYSSKEIEKMSWENLNEMQNSGLVEIYSHTYDHEPVGDRIYTDVRSSIQKGEEMLDKNLQKRSDVKVLTYPNGNYRKDVALSIQHDLGYNLQLTTNFDVVNRNTDMLQIPRITVNSGWTGEQLLQKIEQTAQKTFQQ